MQGVDDGYESSLAHLHQPRPCHTSTLPYSSSSIASSASASATSVWSIAESSQSSDDSSIFDCSSSASSQTSVSSIGSQGSLSLTEQSVESKLAAARSWQKQQQLQQLTLLQQKQQQCAANAQLRQHPRRTNAAPAVLPSLLRQSDRRTTFVDHLVDASTQIVQAIWPLSSVIGRGESGSGAGNSCNGSYLLPLRTFIQETLRRSRASYSTLQVALYYLLLIKPRLPSHNFTMEQPSDSHACRALQCGRRMFLAALILASKYLQDRNYSARAWSKISGLSTAEINQNETAFLHAVNWRLHITNEVYNRWTECVNKFNSPQLPPSPGPAVAECFERKCEEFRLLIQKLSPSLDNLDDLCSPSKPMLVRRSSSCQMLNGALSPVSLCSSLEESASSPPSSNEATPVAKSSSAMSGVVPSIMEPSPATPAPFTPGRAAPAMGLLPTPKLTTPQSSIFGTPVAAGTSAQILSGSRSSMCFAVAQASTACANQFLDRWPPALSSVSSSTSPVGCVLTRRSSLANSVSTASSPESMISDSSLVSRSSSVSSAWSLMNAPNAQLSKLDFQARHRFAKQQCSGSVLRGKDLLLRPTLIPAVVPEDYEAGDCGSTVFASPETITYTGPVGKDAVPELPLSLGRRSSEMDATDAARALAELQQQYGNADQQLPVQRPKTGLKRSRPMSIENSVLQDNVRDLLRGSLGTRTETNSGLEAMVRGQSTTQVSGDLDAHVAARAAALTGSRKRLCRTATVGAVPTATSFPYGVDLQHPSMSGLCGPGMWQGILN